MCPIQTTYAAKHDVATPGQRADFGLIDINSKAAEGSDINFGLAVVRGTGDDQAILPSATGQGFLGITQYTTAGVANSSDVHLYEENREMNIIDFGRVFAICEDGCVPGDDVFFRHTVGAVGTVVGGLRTDADANKADQIIGGKWETTAAAGGIAMIKLNGVSPATSALTLSETITAAGAGVVSLLTQVTLIDSTLGAQALTLADGFESQTKTIAMTVDGGDCVVTPANLLNGTTFTLNDAGDSITLRFVGGTWMIIANNGVMVDSIVETITAAGATALNLLTALSLFDSTLGAQTGTLADGTEGQLKTMKMTVDGGTDMVVTPANLHDGATLTFADVNDSMVLQFVGGTWLVISNNGVVIA